MTEIVAAYAASHTTLQIRARDKADPAVADRVDAAWEVLRARLDAAAPDLVIVLSRDHGMSFFVENYPTFAVGAGDVYDCWGEGGLPLYDVPGRRDISHAIHRRLLAAGFDPALAEDFKLDHGFEVPLHKLRPEMDIPVVPIFQNGSVPPYPAFERCHAMGQALRAVLEAEDLGRVALIATGGISHWVGEPQMGQVNEAFDREVLAMLAEARIDDLLALTPAKIEEELGNGGHELNNWVTLLGVAGDQAAEVLCYEPVIAWATGIAIVDATGDQRGVRATVAAAEPVAQPASFRAAVPVLRLLHAISTDPAVAERFKGPERAEVIASEPRLDPDCRQALQDLDFRRLYELGVPGPFVFGAVTGLGLPAHEVFGAMAQAR